MNILLCTLGMSWPVVPECYALLAPERLDLYRHHPRRATLNELRETAGLAEPDESWLCTTDTTDKMLGQVDLWWRTLGEPCPLRIWIAASSGDLADAEQVRRMRELTLRLTLRAAECCADGGQLVLSLAGGRKTMSADLQRAGQLFGCRAMLHVVGPSEIPAALRGADPGLFTRPLSAELAGAIMPVLLNPARRSELLDVALDATPPVAAARFPLPPADHLVPRTVPASVLDPAALDDELIRREQAGASLFGNFIQSLDEQAPLGNWRSLYRLPPRIVQALKATPLDERSRDWLTALPKAELHCHLGGLLDLDAQQRVAEALWAELPAAERIAAERTVGNWRDSDWPGDWPQRLRATDRLRTACAALLLRDTDPDRLQRELHGRTEPRVGLRERLGFAAYEQPGELSGSALLQHPAAIEAYVEEVVRAARAQGLRYLELRGSPQKYGDGLAFLRALHAALRTQVSDDELMIRFIIIVDRRSPELAGEVVALTVAAHEDLPDLIAGLDLAGAEGTSNPERLAAAFEPVFERCLPVTIHAGEGEPAENIWQAAYRLHADRIGHGLTLIEHPQLLQRFRDRGVCIELCPTSNREVVGFRDPAVPASAGYPDYPLAELLQRGLRVTLCTDNPGISRTTLADEYLVAARMVAGKIRLSRWDALMLIRQAFRGAFLPAEQRARMMREVDHALFGFLLNDKLDHTDPIVSPEP